MVGCGPISNNFNQAAEQPIANTPDQAVRDYFQAVNDQDCEKMQDLKSSNLRVAAGHETREEQFRACEAAFAIVEGKPPLNEVIIEETAIGDNNGRAAVRGEFIMRNDTKQVSDKIIVRLIVEDGMWKLDKLTYKNAPNPT